MASKPFSVESHKLNTGETEVVVTGEIDLVTAPALEEELGGLHGQVVVNLMEVPFMDSRGIHVLVTQKARLEEDGGRMRLVVGTEEISRILELTGLTEMFETDTGGGPGAEPSGDRDA